MTIVQIIGTIVMSVISAYMLLKFGGGSMAMAVLLVVPLMLVGALPALRVYLVCQATNAFLLELGDEETARQGRNVWVLNVLCYGVILLMGIVAMALFALAVALGLLGALLGLIAGICTLLFYHRASKTLGA